tara:strand:- start:216 stop:1157 length:942 start_codon:yes stop_codon:yes gene_type:complete
MSAFKQLTTKDVVITPFEASKDQTFTGNEITGSDVGIEVYYGQNLTSSVYPGRPKINFLDTGYVYKQEVSLIYSSIKQLYYSNYISSSLGDNVPLPILIPGANEESTRTTGQVSAPRYNNYLQSTLTQSRYFPTASNEILSVISIPSTLYGELIIPTTFRSNYTSSLGDKYDIIDDGEGNILVNGDINGQIFYSHGIITITTGSLQDFGKRIVTTNNLDGLQLNFSTNVCIYEHQYKCGIRDNEFTYSQNPSILSGSSDDQYYNFATGSEFVPYLTTVGLYNENNDLLVVGKMSQPIPVSQFTDTTIIVNFDT